MCTHKAHTEFSVKFDENEGKWAQTKNPQMCLLGAHTHTPLSGRKLLTIPQNFPKFHDLTLIARKDMTLLILVAEMDTTFL